MILSSYKKDKLVATFSFAAVFIFSWICGAIALLSFLFGTASNFIFDYFRSDPRKLVETNKAEKNAQLLDVVKNATRVIMCKSAKLEHKFQINLDARVDDARKLNERLFFWKVLIHDEAICNVPVFMTLASMPFIRNASSPEEALDTGFGILVALLALDECHKSLIRLKFSSEKKTQADEAWLAIEQMVKKEKGNLPIPTSTKDAISTCDDPDVENLISIRSLNVQRDKIGLANVTFHYPLSHHGTSSVLNSINMFFCESKIHALTGESGSGKSTALKILIGLMQPTRGHVHLGKIKTIAYVAQDQHLFARSIRDNISYGGDPDLRNNDELLWEGLRKVHLDLWARDFEFGLDTQLHTGENEVSGGQLQRLLLAHLFVTGSDADLVVLDECLSAVDPSTREIIIDELALFLKGKTCVMITHHSELMRICDIEMEMPSDAMLRVASGY